MADDRRKDDIPQPDAPAESAERAQAESFARRVDAMLEGAPPPPLMSADERELLEVATMLRAGHGEVALPAERTRNLIDQALGVAPVAPASGGGGATPLRGKERPHRGRMSRALPWTVAALAAAAAIVLAVTRPRAPQPVAEEIVVSVSVPDHQRSRSADPLVGRIPRAAAGDASSRIDMILADRLDGFRERRFAAPKAATQGNR